MRAIDLIQFILLFIWQLPQNIVALCMMPFLGKLKLISYKNFCYAFEGERMQGGISLGSFAFISPISSDNPAIVAHEQIGHTWWSRRLGPLYLIVIGLPSILHAAFRKKDCLCYYHFFTEAWANKKANVEVVYRENGKCYIKLKED